MPSLIFIGGAPGSGKTTVSRRLHAEFQSVMIDFGTLREFHLDNLWTKESEKEEQMAFENLVFILKNYLRNGYQNVIVNDLKDFRLAQLSQAFETDDFLIVTLVVKDDAVLRARVLDPTRDSGWRNVEGALAWNRAVLERPAVRNEFKLDNTSLTPEETAREIMNLIK
jgi:tRNA uridine 5-carbamoylmethylation protein Kti12